MFPSSLSLLNDRSELRSVTHVVPFVIEALTKKENDEKASNQRSVMRNSALLKWTQNSSNKSGKENKNWIHPPEALQKGHIAYLVKFMGYVEVDEPKGFNVVREAIRKLRFSQQLRKSTEGTKVPKVELTISIEGITVQDPKTKTIMHQYPLYRISYCADDSVDRQFISFIVKEPDSEQHTCFVFISDKLSEEITITIGQAFELAYKQSSNKPNKLSFRARQLDITKLMPIYMSEDLPELDDVTEIKRSVPQMPTGMEKDEECEHHLQRAIFTGTVIPTPEVERLNDMQNYLRIYSGGYRMPKQMIRVHPFAMETEYADYDADSEDERWLSTCGKSLDISTFETMIDKLDKNSNYSVIKLDEAKVLFEADAEVVTAVYDYWLSKRLRLAHSLIPTVKTEPGPGPNDPYVAFRRRKDKMQTRKNRKNDETSYEKMLKLKKDLAYALTLFQLVQKRERLKLQTVHLGLDVYKKRYEARDFDGQMSELPKRPFGGNLYQPLMPLNLNQTLNWPYKAKEATTPTKKIAFASLEDSPSKKEKQRSHRKRRRIEASSDEEGGTSPASDDGPYAFRRAKNCAYLAPCKWPTDSLTTEYGDENRRYYEASDDVEYGFVRRRLGRNGRLILDDSGWTYDKLQLYLNMDISPFFPRAKYAPVPQPTCDSDGFDSDSDSDAVPRPTVFVDEWNAVHGDARTTLEIEFNEPLHHERTYQLLDDMVERLSSDKRDVSGSILEQWTLSKRNEDCRKTMWFSEADVVGCSSFRTSSDGLHFRGKVSRSVRENAANLKHMFVSY